MSPIGLITHAACIAQLLGSLIALILWLVDVPL